MKYKVCKVDSENKFDEWDHCPHRKIAVLLPLLLRPFNAIFRRSAEIRPPIEDRLQHRPCIIDRNANSERQDKREKPNLPFPNFRMEFPLGAKVEKCCRHRGDHKNLQIEQEHSNNAPRGERAGSDRGWMQQHAKESQ